ITTCAIRPSCRAGVAGPVSDIADPVATNDRTEGPCAAHRTSPHGGILCQEGVGNWPGDLLWPSGWRGLYCWLSSPMPCLCRCVVRGQAGAPAVVASVRTRARTNELEAGKRRPRIGSEEKPGGCGCGLPGVRGSGGVVSHPPIRRPPGGGGSP